MKQMTLGQNSLFIAASELVEHLPVMNMCFCFLFGVGEVWGGSWENLSPFKAFLGSKQNIAVVE